MIIDFDLLENPDLPGDFFDESLKDIAKDEGKVLFMSGVSKKTGMELSSLVSMDFQTETITAGYKYPQEQAYEIVNDMTPTQEVFKWARKFYSGSSQDFVNVAKFKPFIPPSRYASNVGMETLELKMIGNGFKFLNPTRGQEMSYGKHCVKEIEENFLVYPTREQIKEGYLNGYQKEKIHAQGIRFVRTKKFTKEKYKEIESMILKETKVEIKQLPLYYRHLGIPIEVYYTKLRVVESSLQRLMPDIMIVEHPSDHFVLRCTRKQIEELMKKAVRVERPWYSCTKYYTRYYSSLKMEDTTAIVVGLDFNPYSPYALDVLTSVEMKDDGIKYSRQYKGEEFYGFFKYSLKRYHSDVWFSSIFTEHTPYTRDLMYNDLAVNHFMAGEILQLKERFTMLGAPILIEPFSINRSYTGNERKSMLRYKADVLGDVTHVPYMTSSVRVSQEYITNCEVVKVDKIVINYRNGKREVYSPFPLQGESTIEDFFRWFANIRKLGIDGVEDYDYVMEQYKKYFVLETYEYNNKVIEKCDGGLINKKTGVTTAQYMIWKVKENETRAGLLCFFVPYCIRRYPHNNMGTIIGDLLHLTLEEAIADITLVKELVKDPPWLFGALKLSNFEYGKKLVQADEELI